MLVRAGAVGREADCQLLVDAGIYPERARGPRPARMVPGSGPGACPGLLCWPMAAGLAAPADYAGTPLQCQGCCASFSGGKPPPEKDGPIGPVLTPEPLRPLGQKPSGQAQRLPPRERGRSQAS